MGYENFREGKPQPRRIRSEVLLRNDQGHVLLVGDKVGNGFRLPGGEALAGEYLADAAARGLKTETGLSREISHFVALDHSPSAAPEVPDEVNIVFDGRDLTEEEVLEVTATRASYNGHRPCVLVAPEKLRSSCKPHRARRICEDLIALLQGDEMSVLLRGQYPRR